MTYVAIYGSALSIPNPEFTRIEKPKIIRHFFFSTIYVLVNIFDLG